ncbi:MAG: carotenoid biosynthesis protein [Candidatus Rokubacteria bacterium]|nr:carotenoid biosynthesis protein [Candidatus Rokubacteria bacterium]
MSDLTSLVIGTIALRPYVFLFFAVYLLAGTRDLGVGRALAFTGWAWGVAFLAEFSSTRSGVPFGLYHYTEATRGQELFLANVPVMDSLSFTFLAYASFSLARLLLARSQGVSVVLVSGLLMMLLDVVIDPLAVRGDRWFLGRIFSYPEGGVYFGVPLSNFLGWAIVGWVIVGGFGGVARLTTGAPSRTVGARRRGPVLGAALYYGVLIFNLAVTWWIGEPMLLAVGTLLHAAAAALLLSFLPRTRMGLTDDTTTSHPLPASSAGFAGAALGGGIGRGAKSPSEVR